MVQIDYTAQRKLRTDIIAGSAQAVTFDALQFSPGRGKRLGKRVETMSGDVYERVDGIRQTITIKTDYYHGAMLAHLRELAWSVTGCGHITITDASGNMYHGKVINDCHNEEQEDPAFEAASFTFEVLLNA